MSQFHRHHPELVGTDADPWMQHGWYRRLLPKTEAEVEAEREDWPEVPRKPLARDPEESA